MGFDDTPQFSRRGFLRRSAAGALALSALPLLNACAPPSTPVGPPSGGAPAAGKPGGAAAKGALPSYIPFTGGPKPDFHDNDPLYSDAFDNYPQNPFKANQSAPGTGGVVNVLVTAYFPLPTPVDQNPTWQAVNKALNADMRLNMSPGADYRAKLATIMASDDLPDIMHIFSAIASRPICRNSSKQSVQIWRPI